MNSTETKEETFEDVDMEPPENSAFMTIPAGAYMARLIGFKTTDKPDWKLTGEEGEDKQQWEWTFQVTEGEYAETSLKEYTNRTWHEKAKAHKHAAALLGVPALPVGMGMTTRQLAGKPCQIFVIEKGTKKDPNDLRNYIDRVGPVPTPRMRPQKPQEQRNREAVPRAQVQGLPSDDDDIDF